MLAHRQAFLTPRASGTSDPQGGLPSPPGVTGVPPVFNRVGGFLAVPASHTTGHTFYVPRRFPSACNAR